MTFPSIFIGITRLGEYFIKYNICYGHCRKYFKALLIVNISFENFFILKLHLMHRKLN
jgi:hypothetical protein